MQRKDDPGPTVSIEQAGADWHPGSGRWQVAWEIKNLGGEPIRVCAGYLPHSQFRGEAREFDPAPEASGQASVRLSFAVSCREAPGATVENAFLILRVMWLDQPWRILARLRVAFGQEGRPRAFAESVTTHRIGFSRDNRDARPKPSS